MKRMKTSAGRGVHFFSIKDLCRSEEAFVFMLALPEPETERGGQKLSKSCNAIKKTPQMQMSTGLDLLYIHGDTTKWTL